MKIAFASDLHFEFDETRITRLINEVSQDTDVLILAGDIQIFGRLISDLEFISRALPDIHIVYITGNHEFYGFSFTDVENGLRDAFDKHPRIHYLEKGTFEIGGVVFLGTTLWTGFDAYPYFDQSRSEDDAMRSLSDFTYISYGGGRFQPYHCKKLFNENCEWLSNTLNKIIDSEIISVVITHFPPAPQLAHGLISTNSLSNYFQANCSQIVKEHQPDYWIYGHNHWSDHKLFGNTQIMSNQLGYPDEYCQTVTMLKYFEVNEQSVMNKTKITERVGAALAVLQRWQCSIEEIQTLIGIDPEFVKADLILDIDQALTYTFSNEANINGFIRMKNLNGNFKGDSPMEYILKEGIVGMTYTLKAIRSMTNC